MILKTKFDSTNTNQESGVDILVYWRKSVSLVWSYDLNDMKDEISMRVDMPMNKKIAKDTEDAELKVSLMPRFNISINGNVSIKLLPNVLDFKTDRNGAPRKNFPLIYRYYNTDMKDRRIRVSTTRIGRTVRKISEGCSFVSIQSLDKPINEKESEIFFESLWQTMLLTLHS